MFQRLELTLAAVETAASQAAAMAFRSVFFIELSMV